MNRKIKILFSGGFRFFEEMKKMKEKLEPLGFECILPRFALGDGLSSKEILKIKEERKRNGLKNGEFEKIIEVNKWYYDRLKECDVMVVFDIGGYIGVSTAVEIGMAYLLEKPVLFLEKPEDLGILALTEISKNFKVVSAEKLVDEFLDYKNEKKVIEFKKLVRDKIPEIMEKKGQKPVFHIAKKDEYWQKLKQKLKEEVEEFLKKPSKEELADILEIIHAICDLKRIKKSELEKVRKRKAKKRGTFKKRIILDKVEEET